MKHLDIDLMRPLTQAFLRGASRSCIPLLTVILLAGCGPAGKSAPEGPPPPAASKTLTTPTGRTMVLLPAGEVTLGDDNGDADEKPAHKVGVRSFYMDIHEMTQQAYESLTHQNPSKFKGADRPVEQVDWYHAILYCNLRSLKEGLKPCYDTKTLACDFAATGYRLPTEAEWEYACRAGTQDKYSFGPDASRLKAYAWFKGNADQATHPVGQKAPNAWGLYDLHGNVAEWCHDFYSETYYQKKEGQDPHCPASCDKCVLRGGSWRSSDDGCRSSARNSETPRFADACFGSDGVGFRCVRNGP